MIFGPGNRGNVYVSGYIKLHRSRFALPGSGSNPKSMSFVGNVVAFFVGLVQPRGAAIDIYNYAEKPRHERARDCLARGQDAGNERAARSHAAISRDPLVGSRKAIRSNM